MTRRGRTGRAGRAGRVAAVLCASAMAVVTVVRAPVAVAAPDVPSYAFADGVRDAPAATSTAAAVRLQPGATYRSTLPADGKAYYRLELDGLSNAYVAVTAIPGSDVTPTAGDGISVSVQDADGISCFHDSVTIGAAVSPQPVTAWGAREIEPGKGLCQEGGTYYVVVQRSDPAGTGGSAAGSWQLELAPVSEPPVAKAPATNVPGTWDSATPAPPSGEPVARPGGAGFGRAVSVTAGVWRDEVVPGETVFYKVPVDWGEQIYAEADLGSADTAPDKNTEYVFDALELSLYNPVRARVEARGTGYSGAQKSAALDPVPPVRYANRYAPTDPVTSLRFAGSYYLVVHLAAEVAERFGDGPYEVTLRVRLDGSAQSGPGYAGWSSPRGIFDVGTQDDPVGGSGTAGSAGGDPVMTAVAAGGLGTGTALVLVLGVWTLVARRRASAPSRQMRASAQNPTA
ncbi:MULTISPECIES: hypothetical protein [Streptomyces]|uniref:Peptidase n=2 Tax=Streptomyces TaxID=1883 RepID=A0ABV9IPY3_9ACTN